MAVLVLVTGSKPAAAPALSITTEPKKALKSRNAKDTAIVTNAHGSKNTMSGSSTESLSEKKKIKDGCRVEEQLGVAWISSAKQPKQQLTESNFDAAFSGKKLSPFKFGAPENIAGKKFEFSFRKLPTIESCDVSTARDGVVPQKSPLWFHYKASDNLTGTSDDHGEDQKEEIATVKKNLLSSVDGQLITDTRVDGLLTTAQEGATNETGGVPHFVALHQDTVVMLQQLRARWIKTLEELEGASEEVLGQIRTTVCQAQLLVDQKLKQFLGLCHSAQKQLHDDIDTNHTTVEDLQGFWDMVSFQVEDIKHKFVSLEDLERNGWVVPEEKVKQKPKKARAVATRKKTTEPVSKEAQKRLDDQREKRAAARDLLREMKAKAKRTASKMTQEEEPCVQENKVSSDSDTFVSSVAVLELATPKKIKNEETLEGGTLYKQVRRSLRRTPSKYRRMSFRSTSLSDDSDVHIQPNRALDNTNLVFYSPVRPGYDFSRFVAPESPSQLRMDKLKISSSQGEDD